MSGSDTPDDEDRDTGPDHNDDGRDADRDRDAIPPELREEVLEEAGYQCQMCPNRMEDPAVTLELHHQVPVAEGGETTKENLTVVCRRCHRDYHGSIRAEDLETDLDENHSSTVDRHLVYALENRGELETRELAIAAATDHNHALDRLRTLAHEGIVSQSSKGTWDLATRVDDPFKRDLYADYKEGSRYSRDALFRELWRSGLSKGDVADLAGLRYTGVGKAIRRAQAEQVTSPIVDNPSPQLYGELVRQVTLLREWLVEMQREITALREQVE